VNSFTEQSGPCQDERSGRPADVATQIVREWEGPRLGAQASGEDGKPAGRASSVGKKRQLAK